MRSAFRLAALLLVAFSFAASAGEYVSQDYLEKLVREIVLKKRKPFPRGQEPVFLKTSRNPELFHGIARLTTREGREISNALVQGIWWGANPGEIIVLEIEKPVRPFTPEYMMAEELNAVTIETKSGVVYHYAFNMETGVLQRTRGPIHVMERDARHAEMAWRLAEQKERQKPQKLSRIEVIRSYYRDRLTKPYVADQVEE